MKESEYILLLSKRFSGEISRDESFVLDEWINRSAENHRFATEHQLIWEKAEGFGKSFAPDLAADFQKVRLRIQRVEKPALRATLGQRLSRVAAVLVLLIASVWGWQQFSATPATEVLVSAENIGKKKIVLPDGTRIWLREGSQLAYKDQFSGKERSVKLKGEAYFEVEHDATRPFKVELEQGGSVEVLGTQFNISQTGQQTAVLVRSGKVRFSPTAQTSGPVLTANQHAVFDHAAAQVRVSTLSSLNDLSWQTGGLEFVNTPLRQVIKDLEKYYGVKVSLPNPAMANCPHSAPLTSQPIEKVLETLALTHQLSLKQTGTRSFELSGGQCK